MADDNVELGRFDLVGIPPAPRGVPQVEVTFDIDANGIVHVSAKDLGTGKEQSIRITAPKKLSKEEIEKMVKDAEKFAAQDSKKKEEVEVTNQADALAYATEKSLKDYGDKVSQAERAQIEAKLNDLKTAIKDKNVDRIKKGMDELTKASHKLAEEVYKQTTAKQQQQAGAGQQGTTSTGQQAEETETKEQPKKGEDVIDAEFKEEDGKDK
jgi:molecular chaperone DnaK